MLYCGKLLQVVTTRAWPTSIYLFKKKGKQMQNAAAISALKRVEHLFTVTAMMNKKILLLLTVINITTAAATTV